MGKNLKPFWLVICVGTLAGISVLQDAYAQTASCVLNQCIRRSDNLILFDRAFQSARGRERNPCTAPENIERTVVLGHNQQVLYVRRFSTTGDAARCLDGSTFTNCGTRTFGLASIITANPGADGISRGEYNSAISTNSRFVCQDGTFRRGYATGPAAPDGTRLRGISKFESSSKRACLLSDVGTIRCAGANDFGQLGLGTVGQERFGLTTVPGIGSNGRDVAFSDEHTCVVLNSGAVSCWGLNRYGQLGNGKTESNYPPANYPSWKNSYESVPVPVSGLREAAKSVAVGFNHSCVLTNSGQVWCWGRNNLGQLGNDTFVDSAVPTKVKLAAQDRATGLAARGDETCAVVVSGGRYRPVCWGYTTKMVPNPRSSGPSPIGVATQAKIPVNYPSFNPPANGFPIDRLDLYLLKYTEMYGSRRTSEVSSGWCVRYTDRSIAGHYASYVRCNGNGNTPGANQVPEMPRLSPLGVLYNGFFVNMTQQEVEQKQLIDLCPEFSSAMGPQLVKSVSRNCCGLLNDGSAACPSADRPYGEKSLDPLGNMTYLKQAFNDPEPGSGTPSAVTQLVGFGEGNDVVAFHSTCVLLESGAVACAGNQPYAGNDPKLVPSLGTDTVQLSAGEGFFCALSRAGTVRCFGRNDRRQLGDGTTLFSSSPVQVAGLPAAPAEELVSAKGTSCVRVGNDVHCWGNDTAPVKMALPAGQRPLHLATRGERTCALYPGGQVWCWLNLQAPELAATAEGNARKIVIVEGGPIAYLTDTNLVGLRRPSYGYNSRLFTFDDMDAAANLSNPAVPRVRDLASDGPHLVGTGFNDRPIEYSASPYRQRFTNLGVDRFAPGIDNSIQATFPAVKAVFGLKSTLCFVLANGGVNCLAKGPYGGDDYSFFYGFGGPLAGQGILQAYPGFHRAPLAGAFSASPPLAQTATATPTFTVTPTRSPTPVPPASTATPTSAPNAANTATPTPRPTNTPANTATPVSTSTPTPDSANRQTPTATPNAPAVGAPQCQDGADNDNDGWIDLLDPGCENRDDTSEEDASNNAPLVITLEGVIDLGDRLNAYLSYENRTALPISIPRGKAPETLNAFSPGRSNRGQPTVFKPGEHKGVVRISFAKDEVLKWTVKGAGGPEQVIEISAESPKILPLKPIAGCVDVSDKGAPTVGFGYQNRNQFEVIIPIGSLNRFAPGTPDRSQPTRFFAGLNAGAFSVPVDAKLSWSLSGESVEISESTPVCDCSTAKNEGAKAQAKKSIAALGEITFEALQLLEGASKKRMQDATPAEKRGITRTLERARRDVADQVVATRAVIDKLPDQSRSCVSPLAGCPLVDDGTTIAAVRKNAAKSYGMIAAIVERISFLEKRPPAAGEKLLERGRKESAAATAALDRIPRFRTKCGK